jgi:DNA-binding NarL/FixJ family response regulator
MPDASPLATNRLTSREEDVLRELCKGASNKEIGRALGIRSATVTAHLGTIYLKTGKRGRTALALWAANNGYSETEEART